MNFLYVLNFYVEHGLYQSNHDYLDKLHQLTYFANYKQINIEHIHAYCDKRKAQGVKNSTINRELTIARSAINYYNKHKDVNIKNPFNGFNLFEEDFIPNYLTVEQCQRLLDACKCHDNPYFYAYVALLLYTGCRNGELLSLTWDNVYLDDGYLIIRNSLSKNKKTVYKPLNKQALAILDSLPKGTHWVFYNQKTGKNYRTFRKAWLTALSVARLSNVRIHDLRHTFASLLVQNGIPLYHVSQLLGHSDTRITQRYAHLSPNNLKDVVDLINFG